MPLDSVFAANRAAGRIALSVAAEGGRDPAPAGLRGRPAARALSEQRRRRAGSGDRQHRGRNCRRRPARARHCGGPRRDARGHDRSGGEGLSHARSAGRDRGQAFGRRGRAARLAAAGDHPVRPCGAASKDRRRTRRRRLAADGRGRGVRPHRHGRGGRARRLYRPLARPPQRCAFVCRDSAA